MKSLGLIMAVTMTGCMFYFAYGAKNAKDAACLGYFAGLYGIASLRLTVDLAEDDR